MHVPMLRQAGRMLPRRSHPRQAASQPRHDESALRQIWRGIIF
jgi:hypothetical protein